MIAHVCSDFALMFNFLVCFSSGHSCFFHSSSGRHSNILAQDAASRAISLMREREHTNTHTGISKHCMDLCQIARLPNFWLSSFGSTEGSLKDSFYCF